MDFCRFKLAKILSGDFLIKKYKAFRIVCDNKLEKRILDTETWPYGIIVDKFYNRPSKRENLLPNSASIEYDYEKKKNVC